MKMRWLASLYIIVLSLIVYLAAQKEYQFLFRPIRRMPMGDKLGHLILMGIFSLILNLALSCRSLRLWKVHLLAGSLIVALVVTLEEFSQLYLRFRTFDLVDLFFDYVGIFLFGQLAYLIMRRRAARAGKRAV